MTTLGPLNDETESDSLAHDMQCVLLSYTRDRPDGGLLGRRLTEKEAAELAVVIARDLSVRIGGRYIRKRERKEQRDAAIWDRYVNGKMHHDQLARLFKVSRKTVSRAIADHRSRLRAEAAGWRK